VAADLAAHKRVETLGGLNIRGYRGPVAHQRQQNELRFVFVGGTRAFGWGEPASGTTVAAVRFELSRVLDRPNTPLRPLVAINLGQLGAGPATYAATLERYASLQPDYVGIIDDLGDPGPNRAFDPSGIFTMTGYRPMLPLVLQEKGAMTSSRAIGAPLESAGRTLAAIDRRLAQAAGEPAGASDVPYADAMLAAIAAAHRHARGVVVALAPIDTDAQRRNFDALAARLAAGEKPSWLRIVDLSERADLYDPLLRLDGFSFGATATSIAAQAIAPAFLDLIPVR
jgi:hypothetical protein